MMKKNTVILLAFLSIIASILACGTEDATPTGDVDAMVAQTMAAYTAEAAQTQSAVPPMDPVATNTVDAPTVSETAPDPLPVTHTGIILNNGECFNFETGAVTMPDTSCDIWLVEPALLRQMNMSRLSGYVTMTVPTRTECTAARYEPGDLAVQTDLYYCFTTSDGNVGFIVPRSYLGGVPFTGISFDYWLFP